MIIVPFKAGDSVMHSLLPFSQTGFGTVISIAHGGRVWVKWEKIRMSVENHWQLKKVEQPIDILKNIIQ